MRLILRCRWNNCSGLESLLYRQKVFSKLKIHASTQMGIHNSIVTRFLAEKGFQRTALARELTLKSFNQLTVKAESCLFIFTLNFSIRGCLFIWKTKRSLPATTLKQGTKGTGKTGSRLLYPTGQFQFCIIKPGF